MKYEIWLWKKNYSTEQFRRHAFNSSYATDESLHRPTQSGPVARFNIF